MVVLMGLQHLPISRMLVRTGPRRKATSRLTMVERDQSLTSKLSMNLRIFAAEPPSHRGGNDPIKIFAFLHRMKRGFFIKVRVCSDDGASKKTFMVDGSVPSLLESENVRAAGPRTTYHIRIKGFVTDSPLYVEKRHFLNATHVERSLQVHRRGPRVTP